MCMAGHLSVPTLSGALSTLLEAYDIIKGVVITSAKACCLLVLLVERQTPNPAGVRALQWQQFAPANYTIHAVV